MSSRVPRHIGVIHPSFMVLGGAENHIVWLIQHWLTKGDKVTVIAADFSKDSVQLFRSMGVQTVSLKLPFVSPYDYVTRHLVLMGWRLKRHLGAFDLINCHNFPSLLWLRFAGFFKRRMCPVIWTCHEPNRDLYGDFLEGLNVYSGLNLALPETPFVYKPSQSSLAAYQLRAKQWDYDAVHNVDTIVCNSAYTAANVQHTYQRSSVVLPFGVAPVVLNDGDDDVNVGVGIQFGMVSRLELIKNYVAVFLAVYRIKQVDPAAYTQLYLNIVGTGSYEASYKALVQSLGIGDHIRFLGFVSTDALNGFYQQQNCMVFVPFGEPLGFIPIEAAYRGIPTIGSNHGGPSETIVHQHTGWLVDATDIEAIATCMMQVLSNPTQCRQFGQNALQHVQANYSLQHTCSGYDELMDELILSEP